MDASRNKRFVLAVAGAVCFGLISAFSVSRYLINANPVDRTVDKLEWANTVYSFPRSMELDETETAKVLLSVTNSIDELKHMVQEQERAEGASVRVSDYMEAKLSGPGFEIVEITPSRQLLNKEEVTQWAWSVKAKATGRQRLNLSLNAIIDDASRERVRSVRTYDKDIEVTVTFPHRVSAFVAYNWRWLWIILIIPTGLLLYSPRIRGVLNRQRPQEGRTRLEAKEPASNYRRLVELIGTLRIEAVFDPFLEERGLDNLLTLIKLGSSVSPKVRLITSSKVGAKVNQKYVRAWLTETGCRLGEFRVSSSVEPIPHRRFILLNGGKCLILGLSLNELGKDEAAHLEDDGPDRIFFDKEWMMAQPL